MIEHYFKKNDVVTRMKKSYFGQTFDDFILHLHNRGYKENTIKMHCQSIGHFGAWLLKNKCPTHKINKVMVHRFLTSHIPKCKCILLKAKNKKNLKAAINQLSKIITIDDNQNKTNPHLNMINTCIQDYGEYLNNVCGLSTNTLLYRTRYVRLFLEYLNLKNFKDLNFVKQDKLRLFLNKHCNHYKSSSIGVVLDTLRSFFKYLILKKYNVKYLMKAVPTIPNWAATSPTNYLGQKSIKKFPSVFDRKTPSGKRDYAIARCLTDLGLRSCEVSEIKLNDINWHEGILQIKGKSHRLEQLPLPKTLANAIVNYLKYGRPHTTSKSLFVFHGARFGQGIHRGNVYYIVACAFRRAGLPTSGPHILRRSFATQLLHAGNPIKNISDILRHKSIATTMCYIKVDLPHLKHVAMPWPVRSK